MKLSLRVALILAALLAFSSAAAVLADEIQNFDTADDAYAHNWVGFNNDPVAGTGGAGGVFKWSNTNNTLGNPAGEAGGTISRTDGLPAYYADVHIGPTAYSVHSDLVASGELFYDDLNTADANILIGYFNKNQSASTMNALDNTIGFSIAGGQITANAFGGDYNGYNGTGGNLGATRTTALPDGVYTWTFTYNGDTFPLGTNPGIPGGEINYGEIVLTMTPVSPAGAPFTLRNALAPNQNRATGGATKILNAFGMISYNGIDSDSFLTDTVFIDGLQYTSVPEPSSLLLSFFGLASLGFFRRLSLSR